MVRKSGVFITLFDLRRLRAKYVQTVDNACASVALLNIINNIPNIDIGDNLRAFKEFTQDFTPALRGEAIANYDFVKKIHNSFARYASSLSHNRSSVNHRKFTFLESFYPNFDE